MQVLILRPYRQYLFSDDRREGENKSSFNTFLVKAQRLIMLLINRPFKIILNDYDFNLAGVIIIIALFCTACDSCTDCFHTLASYVC